MKLKLLTVIMFLGIALASGRVEVTIEGNQHKVVNGNWAREGLVKVSARFNEWIPLVKNGDGDVIRAVYGNAYVGFGFSEGYTAPRATGVYNHAGVRTDWSIGTNVLGWDVIYTHSEREWYQGAFPIDYFFYDDIDSMKISYKMVFDF